MLSPEEKDMKVICSKCKEVMKHSVLDSYEYVEGFPLHCIDAFRCKKCGKLFFTERMVEDMEKRTRDLKMKQFGFKRSLSMSGRGLVVRIPADLIEYLDLKEGQEVKIMPVKHQGFLVERE